ncbi:uncharacterized protein TRUGW13939_01236 [Talaromyces rugulosus]|uniref:VOC domain-containing protein n=1 Tax=Talaromyces rugulosus TaxID=121627 RepID=A0A7H8QKB8_TALRU|nr:uncharacterized protein TRUGW13939_01236 [Talaromyces rugulosus]QKX54152.1 hypothetical protein TRUGW13939_01236 [Talaromyces rugulosus]
MNPTKLLRFCLTFLSIHLSIACNPSQGNSTDPSNPFVIGTDGPAPPATVGYAFNHIGLVTTHLSEMKDFYVNVLGMRTLFDAYITPEYTVTYMGYAQGGRNGTGFQSGADMMAEKNNLYGLVELQQFNVSDDHLLASTKRSNTFGHVGLIVPDVLKAQEYFESKGVPILKKVNVPLSELTGVIPNAYGLGKYAGAHIEAKKALLKAQGLIGIEMFLLIADPDGNLIEIQQQDA